MAGESRVNSKQSKTMKITICLLLPHLLFGCTAKNHSDNCFDGYLVGSFDMKVSAFCEDYYSNVAGIHGYKCSSMPSASPQLIGDIVLREGFVFTTKCYDRMHR